MYAFNSAAIFLPGHPYIESTGDTLEMAIITNAFKNVKETPTTHRSITIIASNQLTVEYTYIYQKYLSVNKQKHALMIHYTA